MIISRYLYFVAAASLLTIGCTHPGSTMDMETPKSPLQLEAEAFCRAQRGDDQLPPKRFTSDGCSLWPDSDWRHCCVTHDMAYWCGGTARQRASADKMLQECLVENGNPTMGAIMRAGTRVGGGTLWPTPWRWGYGWPYPRSGKVEADDSSVDREEGAEVDSQ